MRPASARPPEALKRTQRHIVLWFVTTAKCSPTAFLPLPQRGAGSTATSSGDVMPPEGAGDSAMEYYRNAAIEKKAVANRFIGLRLILRVGWSMRASGHESR